MNRQILSIVAAIVCVAGIAGCESFHAGSAIGGVVAGAAASQTMTGMEKDLENARLKAIEEHRVAVAKLESATDDVERQTAEAQIAHLEKRIDTLGTVETAVKLGKEGMNLDWNNPVAVSGYAGTILSAAIAALYARKSSTVGKKYLAHKRGVNNLMRDTGNKAMARDVYNLIKVEREKLQI